MEQRFFYGMDEACWGYADRDSVYKARRACCIGWFMGIMRRYLNMKTTATASVILLLIEGCL